MKKIFLATFISFISLIQVKADEGMWLMMLINRLNYTDMQKEGLKLTPEEIYSVNHSSLKDAIVSFGGFCTGEIVSDQGLVLTNHHCGFDAIAELSTPQNDYLKEGYFAKNKSQEMQVKGLYVRFLVRMDNVTDRILALVKDAKNEKEREKIIKEESEKIQKENDENGKYSVVVKPFFNGNEFYYFVYQDYKDIRFVGAPPSSIGKFGGDTDNWEWPRHTGDFSMFRIYADAQGNPAEYSPNNVPLAPKHSLPINIKGFKEGDYAMILGYPGTTSRYLSSYGIQQLINYEYPVFIEGAKTAMDVLKKHMDSDKETQLGYASKYASIANYWKNRIGMIESINKNGTIDEKIKQETAFEKWVNSDPVRKKQYYGVLDDLRYYYIATNDDIYAKMYLYWLIRGSVYSTAPSRIGNMIKTYLTQDEKNKEVMKPKLIAAVNDIYEKVNPELETDLLSTMGTLYKNKVKSIYYPEEFKKLTQESKNEFFDLFMIKLPKKSIFETKEKLLDFINNPNSKTLEEDPLYLLSKSLLQKYTDKDEIRERLDGIYSQSSRMFIHGLQETYKNKKFYPDANSTMRLTYGKIQTLPRNPLKPNDAKENYITTLDGMMAKYKKGDEEFDLPAKLFDLYKAKDYGRYAAPEGYLPVNFLSDNDITGGNSGSPVINGKGQLIGLAFDGNWEAMSGNILFENKLQRTISCDIRFVLFLIDKFAGADNIINELKIVND